MRTPERIASASKSISSSRFTGTLVGSDTSKSPPSVTWAL
jgi:hypothetical protein